MTADKRDECGCHRDCTWPPDGDPILGVPGHDCAVPCVWPNCLTEEEADALGTEVLADEGFDPDVPLFAQEPGVILCIVATCPECGAAVLAAAGEGEVTGCAQHTPSGT